MEHEIKKDGFYSVFEILDYGIVNASDRTLQNYAKKNKIRRIDRSYRFTGYQVIELRSFYEKRAKKRAKKIETTERKTPISDNSELEALRKENKLLKAELTKDVPHQEKLKEAIRLITLEAMEQGVTHKVFTEEEYTDIIGTIAEVDFQKEQVEYLRGRVEKQDVILNKLVQQASERNYIEAKEKGFDKK